MRLDDDVDRAADRRRGDRLPVAEELDARDLRLRRVAPRRERAGPQRVAVLAAPPLCEVDVQPRRLDVAEQLVARDALLVGDRRDDVPVAEVDAVTRDGDRPRTLQKDDAGVDRVDRRPVRRGDVDAEVECLRGARDARVVEMGADRVRAVERSQRPGVGDALELRRVWRDSG